MSDLRPGNGAPPPDDGAQRGGLPDLPPEWGSIVIPDDAAELDEESSALRRELRLQAWQNRVRTLLRLGPARRRDAPSIGVPIVIMAVAVITTLLSLFVVTWDHRRNATEAVGPEEAMLQTSIPIAEVTLADATGARVRLRNVLPAVLLLVEDCDCAALIRALGAAAPPPVIIVPVSAVAACGVGTERNVLCLADPAGSITGRYATVADIASASASAGPSTPPALPSVGASGPVASASPTPLRMALAVPVTAEGEALEPVLVTAALDLAGVLAALTAPAPEPS